MDIVTMLIVMVSVALGSMALGLCILYRGRTKAPWAKLLVAFLSVLVGAMTLIAIEHYTSFSLSMFGKQTVVDVLGIVFDSIISLCVVFLILFLPFFVSMVLGKRRHDKKFWVWLSVVSAVYIAIGALDKIFHWPGYVFFQFVIFLGVYFSCLIALWINVGKIKAKETRRTIVAANIVSLSMTPMFILSLIFPQFLIASYGIYYIAFSIVMIVYFFNYFDADFKDIQKPDELTIEDLTEYHISEREFSVIRLIADGLTNKEIGAQLNISVNTVNNHVANIFSKTDVRSRIDLLNLIKEVKKR